MEEPTPKRRRIRVLKRKKIIRKIEPINKTESKSNTIPSVDHYISTLNEDDKKAYDIAKESLGSSFDIEDSIGYKAYCMSF